MGTGGQSWYPHQNNKQNEGQRGGPGTAGWRRRGWLRGQCPGGLCSRAHRSQVRSTGHNSGVFPGLQNSVPSTEGSVEQQQEQRQSGSAAHAPPRPACRSLLRHLGPVSHLCAWHPCLTSENRSGMPRAKLTPSTREVLDTEAGAQTALMPAVPDGHRPTGALSLGNCVP